MIYTIEQQEKSAELLKILTQKSWDSSTFKEQLIKNPVSTIEEVVGRGLSIPSDKRIVVEDQTDDSIIYLNIPARINLDELELTEEQLETISGGSTPVCGAYVAGVVVGIGLCWALSHV